MNVNDHPVAPPGVVIVAMPQEAVATIVCVALELLGHRPIMVSDHHEAREVLATLPVAPVAAVVDQRTSSAQSRSLAEALPGAAPVLWIGEAPSGRTWIASQRGAPDLIALQAGLRALAPGG